MSYLLSCYFMIIGGFVLLAYWTMRRSIPPKFKAFIYGALTFVLLMVVFLVFEQYESKWKAEAFTCQAK